MPPISYPISGIVKDSRNNLLTSLSVFLRNSTKSTILEVTTDSNGRYDADAANFLTGYDTNDTIVVDAYNSFKDEYKSATFTITGSSKTQNLTLEVISALQKGTTGYQEKVVLTNVNSQPYTKYNPLPTATMNILEGYQPADDDSDQDPEYYSFVDKDENWYIKEINRANGTTRFAKGSSNYVINWNNRLTGFNYDYFYNIF